MAKFNVDFPVNLLEGLETMFDTAAPKMIDAALPIYEKAVKTALEEHRDTGELIESVRCNSAIKTKTDAYIGYLTAEGESKKSTYKKKKAGTIKVMPYRNYQKILALEYGNSHQKATPFLGRAQASCEAKIKEKMQKVFNEEVAH